MAMSGSCPQLTEVESLTLLGVEYLTSIRQEAHGSAIWYWLDDEVPELVSRPGIYHCLLRLYNRGLLEWLEGPPTKQPGGRRRSLYKLTVDGKLTLARHRSVMQQLWG